MKKPLLSTLLLIAATASPALAQHEAHNSAPPAAKETPSDKAFMDSHHKMMKDMGVPPTGNADADFVAMMIPHHQGAVDMAKVQMKYGKDPELRKLAEEIIAAQEKEIALMKEWQEKNAK